VIHKKTGPLAYSEENPLSQDNAPPEVGFAIETAGWTESIANENHDRRTPLVGMHFRNNPFSELSH
jgi:hypothetical protein